MINGDVFVKMFCFGGLNTNYLIYLLIINNTYPVEEIPELKKQSPYFDDDSLISTLNAKHNDSTILSLICQSINAKIYSLKQYYKTLRNMILK